MSGLADADVEGLARALGVWHEDTEPLDAGKLALVPLFDGRMRVKVGADRVDVDRPTSALLLLGHARGLRLDLGECPACRERGSKRGLARWEWKTHAWDGPGCEDFALNGAAYWASLGFEAEAIGGTAVASRPCPACTVDANPTARESLDWATALARAMPEPPCCSGIDCGCYGLPTPGEARVCEALGVLADQLQVQGDPLGVWLTAWLLDDGGRALASYLGDIGAAVRAETHALTQMQPRAWL